MSYAIVEFVKSKEVEVVPVSWVSDRQCHWPDHVKAEKASRMVKKQTPPQAAWKRFDIAVKGLFGTYDSARKNLNRSQFHSDLGSDSEAVPRKRCRRPPRNWTDSDSNASGTEEATAKTCPLTLPAIPKNFPQGLTSSQMSSGATGSEREIPRTGLLSRSNSSCSERDNTVDAGQPVEVEKPQSAPTEHGSDQYVLQHMLRLLNTIRFMLQQQAESINKLCEMLPSAAVTTCTPLVNQPFNCLRELLDFDAKLTRETTSTLVREFMQLGGKDAKWATKRILGYCLTDELAAQFSWLGRKGKHSFAALNIAKAVADAARKAPKGTAADVEEAIKSWLRHAPERLLAKAPKTPEHWEPQQTSDSN